MRIPGFRCPHAHTDTHSCTTLSPERQPSHRPTSEDGRPPSPGPPSARRCPGLQPWATSWLLGGQPPRDHGQPLNVRPQASSSAEGGSPRVSGDGHAGGDLSQDGVWEPRAGQPGADVHPAEPRAGPPGVSPPCSCKPPGQQAALGSLLSLPECPPHCPHRHCPVGGHPLCPTVRPGQDTPCRPGRGSPSPNLPCPHIQAAVLRPRDDTRGTCQASPPPPMEGSHCQDVLSAPRRPQRAQPYRTLHYSCRRCRESHQSPVLGTSRMTCAHKHLRGVSLCPWLSCKVLPAASCPSLSVPTGPSLDEQVCEPSAGGQVPTGNLEYDHYGPTWLVSKWGPAAKPLSRWRPEAAAL